ncbi:DUF4124 domain-containing protein [Thermomonas sp.]|uniref:DUF4124 domain-containing protein n=1 Tax=Thermomonas sp. TaxID=1971895 RepID=UPI002EFC9ABC
MHTIRPLALALALAAAVTPAIAQQRVYQWKDANGVTHYTDVAPKQSHQARDIEVQDGRPATPAAKAQESEQCTNARANVARLQGGDPIGMDANGDGKPDRNLTADERKAQLDLNQAAVKAFCTQAKP